MTLPYDDEDLCLNCDALMRLAHAISDQNPAFLVGFLMAGAVAAGRRHGFTFDQLAEEFGLSMEAFIQNADDRFAQTTH